MSAASPEKAGSTNRKHDFSDDINAELSQIRDDIAKLTKTLGAFGKDSIGSLPDMASKSTDDDVESARRAFNEIRREITSAEHDVEQRVAEHPMQSLLIAVGLGFLVAFLVRR